MMLHESSCFKCVGICSACNQRMIKYGTTKSGNQRYYCKSCKKTKVCHYLYKAYNTCINQNIIILTKEGLGIRSTARVLSISTTTVLKRIITIANTIVQPIISKGKTYEVDEIRTFIKRKTKLIWIVYALEQMTKRVVSFNIGRRTNKTLKNVIISLELSNAKKIITDKLPNYKYLIPQEIHSTKFRGINHIERNNLSIRTHLKRLNRRTICFSKSMIVLNAVLRIYFWG